MRAQLRKYPIVPVFLAVLVLFSFVDIVKPDKESSELENRMLRQAPTFSWDSLLENQWTQAYGEYTREQFLLRDEWVSLQSVFELALGKLEAGGVWYADDGYQIAKNSVFTNAQQLRLPANVQAVSELAQRHEGQVHAIVVPSPANILSSSLPWSPPQIDENALTDEMFTEMRAAGVNVVELRDDFTQYNQEGAQLYYRTDHHWTTDGGAAIAYEAFCEATGQTAVLPSDEVRMEVPGFLGTNFAKTKRFGTPSETLVYYDLPNAMTIHTVQNDGSILQTTEGIMDTARFDDYDKYAAFLHGNNGYSVIQGNGEGSILVVKDSYANSFVPYLVENYATIGIIDLRAWFEVDATFTEGNYDEILVLYSFASFSEDAYLSRMSNT